MGDGISVQEGEDKTIDTDLKTITHLGMMVDQSTEPVFLLKAFCFIMLKLLRHRTGTS